MLQKSRSKTISKFKFLVLLPLMLVMLTYVACSDDSTVNSQQEDSLAQYSYTMNKNEEMSDEKRKVHQKYEDFLTNNPGYVSWATINGNEISYSVHRVDEEVPEGYIKLEVSDKYEMYINLPGTAKDKKSDVPSEKINFGDGGVPFAVIEQVPIFPGCENLGGNEEQKKCMSEKIQKHVLGKFDTSLGKKLGLKGVNRVIAIFTISPGGEITGVRARAPHPDLEAEAKRVIEQLPQMEPGKHNGKAVAVSYSLPIVFQIGE